MCLTGKSFRFFNVNQGFSNFCNIQGKKEFFFSAEKYKHVVRKFKNMVCFIKKSAKLTLFVRRLIGKLASCSFSKFHSNL